MSDCKIGEDIFLSVISKHSEISHDSFYLLHTIKEYEMEWAWCVHGKNEECIQNFSTKSWRENNDLGDV